MPLICEGFVLVTSQAARIYFMSFHLSIAVVIMKLVLFSFSVSVVLLNVIKVKPIDLSCIALYLESSVIKLMVLNIKNC